MSVFDAGKILYESAAQLLEAMKFTTDYYSQFATPAEKLNEHATYLEPGERGRPNQADLVLRDFSYASGEQTGVIQ